MVEVRFDDPSCEGIATTFGSGLDERSLEIARAEKARKNVEKTMDELHDVRLGLLNAATRALAQHDVTDCTAGRFLTVAEQRLSTEFREEIPFWLTGDPGEQHDYSFWRGVLQNELVRLLTTSSK